jgi:hypothetical protein
VQTFLPFADFDRSAAALDTRRLGKQIIEARQIGLALTVDDYGWKNHPAVRMWSGYEFELVAYAEALSDEWLRRRDKIHGAFENMLSDPVATRPSTGSPPWLGDERFHRSHRSNLYFKDPVHYGVAFHDEIENGELDVETRLEYWWPTKETVS